MTKDSKTVKEVEFKFFNSYSDAVANKNYWIETVEVEGSVPFSRVQSKKIREFFELRSFSRGSGIDRFIENVFIKV